MMFKLDVFEEGSLAKVGGHSYIAELLMPDLICDVPQQKQHKPSTNLHMPKYF